MIVSAVVIFETKDGQEYWIPCHRHADAFYIIGHFLSSENKDYELEEVIKKLR